MTAELIARLEKATGPDRELDAAIARAVGWKQVDRPATDWIAPDGYEYYGLYPMPSYTASTDAALTLVRPGDAWSVSQCDDRDDKRPHGVVMRPLSVKGAVDGTAYAATPAIALCIAALKALEGKTDGE